MEPTERELLKLIGEHPDQDAPRLVYADWLIDQGEARGEFITLQIHGRDPQRQNELLANNRQQWLQESVGGHAFQDRERGFLRRPIIAEEPTPQSFRLSPVVYRPETLVRSYGYYETHLGHPCHVSGSLPPEKVILKRQARDISLAGQSQQVARFLLAHESDILERVNHAGVQRLHCRATWEGDASVLEHLSGVTLHEVCNRRDPLGAEVAVAVGLKVLDALVAIHSALDADGDAMDIVVRELHAGHLVLLSTGEIKLTEFMYAASSEVDSIHQESRRHDRTPEATTYDMSIAVRCYSPEMVQGAAVDARSDLFAVGVLIHELATSRSAFGSASQVVETLSRIAQCDYTPPPEFHQNLLEVLSNTLTRYPDDRYQSARDMKDALTRVAEHNGYNLGVLASLAQETSEHSP